VNEGVSRLRQDYMPPFLSYLTRRDEEGLRAAYELGRNAMLSEISLLHLVQVHHAVLIDVLVTAKTTEDLEDIGRAAANFLVDALSSFEMTQRGFIEKTSELKGREA
jgi:Phosphoserine phosphatase RsbU, N-terminal domain